jgi:hypothetical protein
MIDFRPLPWGEGGESSGPGKRFLPTEPRNFVIWVQGEIPRSARNDSVEREAFPKHVMLALPLA